MKLGTGGGCMVCIPVATGEGAECGTVCTALHCGHFACLPAAVAGTFNALPQP
jgi:hypothetical protein